MRFPKFKILFTIPILTAFALVLGNYVQFDNWSWNPLIIAVQIVSIPSIIAWLTKKFDKKELALEKGLSATKEEYHKKEIIDKDELNAIKITSEVRKREIEILSKELELLKEKEN